MLDVTKSLPEDPAELRAFTALLLAEVKSQAVLIRCPATHACMCERGEAAAPVGRPTFPSVRAIVRDVRAVATGAGDARAGHRRPDGQAVLVLISCASYAKLQAKILNR